MNFTEELLCSLRDKVKARLSEKRYLHTLGVERAAVRIGEKCLPEALGELRVAALLHDVSKEFTNKQQLEIIAKLPDVTADDMLSIGVHHSLSAPYVAEKEFSVYATDNVLSALKNHTTGAPDMSVFDEIIFLSDFVEDTRQYSACINAREKLFRSLDLAKGSEECLVILHNAVIETLDFTIKYLIESQAYLNGRTVATRNAFLVRYSKSL